VAAIFIISLGSGIITHMLVLSGMLDNNALKIKTENQNMILNKDLNISAISISTASACECTSCEVSNKLNIRLILAEMAKASLMVVKFMGIAFLISAIIKFYVPEKSLTFIIDKNPSTQIIFAVLTGIPLYTTNITALPVASGLIDLGLNKGAALAFLIAGATTTLPAMAAVYGLTIRKVFILYLAFATIGSLLAGILYNFVN
jgi:uncharacterized membrane protein YraQ (UPF0718 family)